MLIKVFVISAELKDQLMFTQKQAEEGKVKEQKYNALKGKVSKRPFPNLLILNDKISMYE